MSAGEAAPAGYVSLLVDVKAVFARVQADDLAPHGDDAAVALREGDVSADVRALAPDVCYCLQQLQKGREAFAFINSSSGRYRLR